MAGRVTLAKSVLEAIPNYYMHAFTFATKDDPLHGDIDKKLHMARKGTTKEANLGRLGKNHFTQRLRRFRFIKLTKDKSSICY